MEPRTPLSAHAQTLPPDWKWQALFAPPSSYEGEWQTWLATAQQEEQSAMLRFWSERADRAA